MKRAILFMLLAVNGWAYSSLVVGSGVSGVLKVPAVAPFTSLGDYRVEFRIHDWSMPANANIPIISWGSSYTGRRFLELSLTKYGEICAGDYVDSTADLTCANISEYNDVIVRIQRFGNLPSNQYGPGSFLLEARSIGGNTPIPSYCGSNVPTRPYACTIKTPNTADWSTMPGYIGNPNSSASFSLAWLKWFSTTVPPGSTFSQESTAADLADWRFENSPGNTGTGGYAATIGSFTRSPAYGATPSYSPGCVAGAQQVFRAGYPAQLDGTGSYPLNGGSSLSFFWQEISGPTQVRWIGQTLSQPTVSRTAFGSYVFQLTVTDSTGQSSTCTVKDGFVATDDNNVVITGNPAADTLLGPMVRYGANPWPWFDDRHKADADLQASVLDTYFAPFWETPLAGTVEVTADSPVVMGYGTTFTTTFCQGPGAPTTPKKYGGGNIRMLVRYPDSSLEGLGVRGFAVASCESDTQLTLADKWYPDVADCHGGRCSYSANAMESLSGAWDYNIAPANFYDAVAAFYSLYYRTGVDDYRGAARKLADRFWKYRLDSGTSCRLTWPYPPDSCPYPRNISLLGMVLRAMDGRPDMWPGLERMFTYYIGLLNIEANKTVLGDIRESAYRIAMVSYCAMYDPDATYRANCKAALSNDLIKYWNVQKSPDGSWQQMFYTANSWTPTTTVSLTNGSTSVVGNGTQWASTVNGGHIVFTPSSAQPLNQEGQESTYYTITYLDGTHLTLDRPYRGTTGTHGWIISNTGAVGWGAQPFIESVLATAFEFASQAIADTDPVNASLARSHTLSIARWERDNGLRASTKGMWYFVGSVDCMPPIPESSTWCASSDAVSSRYLNGETMRGVMLGYSHSGDDATLRAFGDLIYNANWAKPGTCPAGSTLCVPDGIYQNGLDGGTGWYMTGTPPNNAWHKTFGMMWGIGAGSAWPAYRVGGVQPIARRRVRVGFNRTQVPGAAQVRVTTTAPTGEVQQTLCTSSPCAVSIDGRSGEHIFRLEYLSDSGKVLAVSDMPSTEGR